MKISTRGRYALRIMVDLAQRPGGEFVPLKAIAQEQGLTIKYLEQIISSLNRAGFLHSIRGIGGGYRLASEPREYTVGQVLRASEGSLAPVACLEAGCDPCPRSGNCITLPVWEGLKKVIDTYLDSITLQDLLDGTVERFPENV